MKVITTKAGPFSFNGVKIVQIKEGQIFEGSEGEKLESRGWAEEHLTDEEAEDAAELARQQEADKIQATKDAEAAEEKRIKDEEEAKQKEQDEADALARKEQEDKDAAALAEAQKLVDDMEKTTDKTPAKGKSPKAKSKGKGKK